MSGVPEDLTDAEFLSGNQIRAVRTRRGERTARHLSERLSAPRPPRSLAAAPRSLERLCFRNFAAGEGFQFAADQVWREARAHEAAIHGSDLAVIDFAAC
jgi:hypothetical protein